MPPAATPSTANPLRTALERVRARLQTHPEEAHTLDEAAVLLYQAGAPAAAVDFAVRATRAAPKDPVVHDHLALILLAAGRPLDAVAAGRRAAALAPRHPSCWLNLGNALLAANDPTEAVAALRKATTLAPRDPLAWFNLGNALSAHGAPAEAIAALQRAVGLDRALAPARRNLALLLREAGRPAEAIAALAPLASSNDPDVLHLLGNLHLEAADPAAALAPFRAACELRPQAPEIQLDLIRCLVRLERKAEAAALCVGLERLLPDNALLWNLRGLCATDDAAALDCYRRALALQPGYADAAVNLARCLVDRGQPAAAITTLDDALARTPHHAELHYTRGVALLALDRAPEALAANSAAIAVQPTHPNAHWNRALCHLRLGNFREGWPGYEWRWRREAAEQRRFTTIPEWPADQPRAGRLLVWSEQGVGDEVMFGTLLPHLAPVVDHLVVTCCPRLVPLFRRSFPGIEFVAQDPDRRVPDPAVSADWQIPAGSLPARLWSDSGPPGDGRPVLTAAAELTARLRARYRAAGHPAVGLAWRTGNAKNGAARSIPPELWAPPLQALPFPLVSLQYGDTGPELAQAAAAGTSVFQDPEVDQMRDLDAFAAQIAALDAVLTIDNSTAHFAGALGRPTWLLLPTPADWRWRSAGKRTPWYQSVRIHRKSVDENWDTPLARAIAEIRAQLS